MFIDCKYDKYSSQFIMETFHVIDKSKVVLRNGWIVIGKLSSKSNMQNCDDWINNILLSIILYEIQKVFVFTVEYAKYKLSK
jgi:hypothetical protein